MVNIWLVLIMYSYRKLINSKVEVLVWLKSFIYFYLKRYAVFIYRESWSLVRNISYLYEMLFGKIVLWGINCEKGCKVGNEIVLGFFGNFIFIFCF